MVVQDRPALSSHLMTARISRDPSRRLEPLEWRVAPASSDGEPEAELVRSVVPGAVQLDWGRAHELPDYWVADGFRAYQALEDRYWLYRSELAMPTVAQGERCFF